MNVLTRFTDDGGRTNLSHYIDIPEVYPVGRLDLNSEGLLALTDRGSLVQPLLRPGSKEKQYLVCVEGRPTPEQLSALAQGPVLKDGATLPAVVELLAAEPDWLWERDPPIRYRRSVPVSWLRLTISEGRNRQVRRMTAAVGLPTLRLVRTAFAGLELGALSPGEWREATEGEKRRLLSLESSRRKLGSDSGRGQRRRTRRKPGPSRPKGR